MREMLSVNFELHIYFDFPLSIQEYSFFNDLVNQVPFTFNIILIFGRNLITFKVKRAFIHVCFFLSSFNGWELAFLWLILNLDFNSLLINGNETDRQSSSWMWSLKSLAVIALCDSSKYSSIQEIKGGLFNN